MAEERISSPTGDGWDEHRLLVMNSLGRLEKKVDELTEKVVNLRIQAGVWGAVAGIITALVTALAVAAAMRALGL